VLASAGPPPDPGSVAAALDRADQEPIVAGVVVDQGTGNPLADARVTVAGTSRATVTDARGQFRLTGLTGSEVSLVVVRIGYRRVAVTARVGAADLRIELSPQVVNLDEVVVTGTAAGQEVRTLGNAITRVNLSALEEIAPSVNLQGLLQTQVPGLAVLSAGGNVGAGATYRLRGASSLALASNPLIYVDGVRIDNNPSAGVPRALFDAKIGNDGRFGPSRINDLNPDEIESIQVIKGPSAATIYGTEASNGVIQIITKRGRSGRAEIQLTARQGATWLPSPEKTFQSKYYRSASGQIVEFNILEHDRTVGFPVSRYGYCPEPYRQEGDACRGSPFSTGLPSSVAAILSGGPESVRYFFSADFERDEGTVSYNWQNRLSTRGNITWAPSAKMGLDVGIGYTRSKTRSQAPMSQPVILGIDFACPSPGCEPGLGRPNGADGPFRGYQFVLPERLANDAEGYDEIDRVILNSTLRHQPAAWFSHRLTVGGDVGNQQLSGLFRRVDGAFAVGAQRPNGVRAVYAQNVTYASLDYGATATVRLGSRVESQTSAGAQYYRKRTHIVYSTSENLAVNSLGTLGAGSIRNTDENQVENKTFGAYVQQQVGWKNRLFLTAALRGDDNSAFGTDFDFVLYPKLSGSWVVSDEPFFSSSGLISTLKVRAAWGRAGQQPDAFVALQTFRPYVGDAGAVGLTTDNFGNPDLKPEVATEVEAGFDASLFNERIGVEFTYYRKQTRDAIIPVPVRPSSGFAGTQLLNLGEILNTGAELAANATLHRSRGLTIDLRTAVSVNSNEIQSLGAGRAALTATQFNQFQVPGFPIASFFHRRVVSSTITNGVATNVMCEGGDRITGTNLSTGGGAPVPCAQAPEIYVGGVLPTWQGATSLTIAVGPRLQLFGQVDYAGGHYGRQSDVAATFTSFRNSRAVLEATDPIVMGAIANTFDSRLQLGLMRQGYAKVRDLSATYTFSEAFARKLGSQRFQVTASLKNLWTVWQSQRELFGRRMKDPELRMNQAGFYAGDPGGFAGNLQDAWPTPRRFLVTVRTVF
jgi:TonB-linked SusC/RagA family outer membrane protein